MKQGFQMYTKETVYVRLHNQTWVPTNQDLIQLDRINLFDVDEDSNIHSY